MHIGEHLLAMPVPSPSEKKKKKKINKYGSNMSNNKSFNGF